MPIPGGLQVSNKLRATSCDAPHITNRTPVVVGPTVGTALNLFGASRHEFWFIPNNQYYLQIAIVWPGSQLAFITNGRGQCRKLTK